MSSTGDSRLQKVISLLAAYRVSPELYVRQELGVTWWRQQAEVAAALVRHKRVLVKASHSVGKTHLAGGIVNWFFDAFSPSITLTTAPTKNQVEDLLWKEVRTQRGSRPGLQPKAPRMELAPNHFAAGLTARDAAAFQGRHEESVLIVFDEAVGIEAQFWDAAEGMLTGERCYWLALMNPTDPASRAYEEELGGGWHVMTISAMEHPNVAADLAGARCPYPAAVRAAWIEERVQRWCMPLGAGDRQAGDVEWPPASSHWYRPGPLFESRVLGRWPSSGSRGVWSDALWLDALIPRPLPQEPLDLGCDVARYGEDFTSIVARRGACAVHHETHNGWSTVQTAGQLKALAKRLAQRGEEPERVPIKVDDDGVGGGVTDQKGNHNFIGLHASERAIQADDYPNRRSELWFATAERAAGGRLDLSRLSAESLRLLRPQVMAPTWKLDAQGRRVVESKDLTKKRVRRSPDDADALNLAYAAGRWHQDKATLEWLKARMIT